ncbi:unnamed protein product [Schistocephalus solidus]|nr:unnamed protein product [Schistocephalus solidus]
MFAPNSRAPLPALREPDFPQFCAALTIMFHDAFGANCIEGDVVKASADHATLLVDDFRIKVNLKDLNVSCPENVKLEQVVQSMVKRLHHSLSAP